MGTKWYSTLTTSPIVSEEECPRRMYCAIESRHFLNFFADKKDTTAGVKLFSDKSKNKFNNMLGTIKKGYASDPSHMATYAPKTDIHGRPMADNDGLILYR